jgi:type IV pilus assembly protein PilB
MLVGEVRDLETAEICIRSALTGHLVLSTLHTNDAPSAIARLVDIGVAPYLLVPSLLCIVGQRLIRKLCPNCKVAYEPKAEELVGIKLKNSLIYKPKGCPKCNQLGYRGRSVITEVLVMNEKLREAMTDRSNFIHLKEIAKESGMMTLHETALKKVDDGITSLEEALSVTMDF